MTLKRFKQIVKNGSLNLEKHCTNAQFRWMYRGCQYDHLAAVEISDKCPICGQKRGSLYNGKAYDGSIPYYVDQWDNPCGHNDLYNSVFHEAMTNGYNLDLCWDFNNLNGFKITSENEKAILTDIRYKYHKNPKDDTDRFRLLVEIVEFIRYKNPQSKIKITYAGDLVDKEGECENFIKQYVAD